jgi:2-C-methyl-D-erythritol 2,4-cyclodiphosphate synthase/2-C-methyl-D-erythritol 4-phosphate cytidylyltransferase
VFDRNQMVVIVPAGGTGSRMGLSYPKQLLPFAGATVLERVLDLFEGMATFVPVPAEYVPVFREKVGDRCTLLAGGATRFDSVRRAFEAAKPLDGDTLVLIHDAARPFLDGATVTDAAKMARDQGALIYATAATDTVKWVEDDHRIARTLDRRQVFLAQTPQIFKAGLLQRAYDHFDQHPDEAPTDEARLLEMAGISVYIFESSPRNRKLTYREDLDLIEESQVRIGHGYDVHRFDAERPLYLGGILIENAPGLLGHSDADVAIHALIDAMLGAAGAGDIGQWFPPDRAEWKDVRSTLMLRRVCDDLAGRGFHLVNADITIEAQVPKLAPHIAAMRACLSELLGCPHINIKATTTERLGFVGREEGMAATAVVLMRGGGGR